MTVPFRGAPDCLRCSALVGPMGDGSTALMAAPPTRSPQCGTTTPPQAQFCMRCGTALVQRCATCGRVNPSGAQFCLQCGTPLRGTGAAERRVVTVLFADLAGSTRLTKQLDPEPMRALMARFFAAMREEITRYGGTVEKFIGDAVMAVFGMPAAHEDDPERALRAALAIQRRMASLNAELDADLHLRTAITTGEVVADLLAAAAGQFMVTGEVVNFAARLQAQAPPDGIVMDDRTCEATRHAIAHEPLPPLEGEEFGARPRFRVTGLTDKPPARRLRAEAARRRPEGLCTGVGIRRERDAGGRSGHDRGHRDPARLRHVVENPAGQAQNPGRRPSRGGPGSQRRQRDASQQ